MDEQPAGRAHLVLIQAPPSFSSTAAAAWEGLFAGRNEVDRLRLLRNLHGHSHTAEDLRTALLHGKGVPKKVTRFLKLVFNFVTGRHWTDVSNLVLDHDRRGNVSGGNMVMMTDGWRISPQSNLGTAWYDDGTQAFARDGGEKIRRRHRWQTRQKKQKESFSRNVQQPNMSALARIHGVRHARHDTIVSSLCQDAIPLSPVSST